MAAGDCEEYRDRRAVQAHRRTVRFPHRGGQRADTKGRAGVHRQPFRGGGQLQVQLQ